MHIPGAIPDGSRAPQGGVLHRFLADEFPGYFERRLQANRPPFMVTDVNAFLGCGDIKRSNATLQCFKCSVRRDIPLSCKRRSFCEPCAIRRQQDRSNFLHHQVFGTTPTRLWTTVLPHPFRTSFGADSDLVTRVLNVIIHRITRYIRLTIKHAMNLPTVANVHPGSVTTIQRASSALDPNIHFHSLFTDGAFVRLADGEPLTFVELPPPSDSDLAVLAWDICRAVRKLLWSLNRWEDLPSEGERTVWGKFITHDGRPVACRLTGVAANQQVPKGVGAFNLDASRAVGRGDSENMRRMIQYLLAPAIRDKQLTLQKGGAILELKRPRLDGTTHRHYTIDQMLDRLDFLVPPPRANSIRFHGVFGANSGLRDEAVPRPQPESADDQPSPPDNDESPEDYLAWAELRSHSFSKDTMRCPVCAGRLQLVALNTDRITYRRRRPKPRH